MKISHLVKSIEAVMTGAGNGAREAMTEIETLDHPGSICWADWVLLELAARGFKVVPMEDGGGN